MKVRLNCRNENPVCFVAREVRATARRAAFRGAIAVRLDAHLLRERHGRQHTSPRRPPRWTLHVSREAGREGARAAVENAEADAHAPGPWRPRSPPEMVGGPDEIAHVLID